LRAPLTPLNDAADGVLLSAEDGEVSACEMSERFGDRVAILIPAFGEAENLPELLPLIPESVCGVPAAVLVIDDGSADDTTGAAVRSGAVVATLPANAGGGAALRVGYSLMLAAGARVVVTMDADGQHLPEDLDQVAEPVLSGRVQFSQGSRILGHSEPGVFARELGIALFNRLVRFLTRTHVTDCSNGFRAIRTDLLAELDLRQPQFHAPEFLIEAITRGITLQEVPITVVRRHHGRSKKPATVRYGIGFCRSILEAWRRSIGRPSPSLGDRAAPVVERVPAGQHAG